MRLNRRNGNGPCTRRRVRLRERCELSPEPHLTMRLSAFHGVWFAVGSHNAETTFRSSWMNSPFSARSWAAGTRPAPRAST